MGPRRLLWPQRTPARLSAGSLGGLTPGSPPPAELLCDKPYDAPNAVQHQPPDDGLLNGGYHAGRGKPRGDDPNDNEPADRDRDRAPFAVCGAATVRAAHESRPYGAGGSVIGAGP